MEKKIQLLCYAYIFNIVTAILSFIWIKFYYYNQMDYLLVYFIFLFVIPCSNILLLFKVDVLFLLFALGSSIYLINHLNLYIVAFLTILWLAVAVKFCIDLKVSDKLEKSILLPTHFEFAFLLILMALTGKNFFSVMILLLLVLSIVIIRLMMAFYYTNEKNKIVNGIIREIFIICIILMIFKRQDLSDTQIYLDRLLIAMALSLFEMPFSPLFKITKEAYSEEKSEK